LEKSVEEKGNENIGLLDKTAEF